MSTQSLELTQEEHSGLTLDGLAAVWEGSSDIRRYARQHQCLLYWKDPSVVGVASMTLGIEIVASFSYVGFVDCAFWFGPVSLRKAVAANSAVLAHAAAAWVAIFDFEGCGGRPKTLPLNIIYDQVSWVANMLFVEIGL